MSSEAMTAEKRVEEARSWVAVVRDALEVYGNPFNEAWEEQLIALVDALARSEQRAGEAEAQLVALNKIQDDAEAELVRFIAALHEIEAAHRKTLPAARPWEGNTCAWCGGDWETHHLDCPLVIAKRALSATPPYPEPPAATANPWRAELDMRIERYVSAFSRNPATLTDEEFAEWQRRRARLERDVVSAFTDFAMREAKNRNGVVSDTPAPPAAPPGVMGGADYTTAEIEFISGLADKEIMHGRGANKEERVRIARGFQAMARRVTELRAALTAASPARRVDGGGAEEVAKLREQVRVLAPYQPLLESLMHHVYAADGDAQTWLTKHQPAITDAMSDYDDWLDARAALAPASGAGPDTKGETE